MSKKKRPSNGGEAELEGAVVVPSDPVDISDEPVDPEIAELASRFAAEEVAAAAVPKGTLKVKRSGVWFGGRKCQEGDEVERPADLTDEQVANLRANGWIE